MVDAAARTSRRRLWATVQECNVVSSRVLGELKFERSGHAERMPSAAIRFI